MQTFTLRIDAFSEKYVAIRKRCCYKFGVHEVFENRTCAYRKSFSAALPVGQGREQASGPKGPL
jgi:hypothetical protein